MKNFEYTKEEQDNRSAQLNPNNDSYWQSRGYDERPENWNEIIKEEIETENE